MTLGPPHVGVGVPPPVELHELREADREVELVA